MSFRTRLLALFTAGIVLTAGLVAWLVSDNTRRAFNRMDDQRTANLVAQFRREFARRGQQVEQNVERIAAHDSTLRMAAELSRPAPDYGPYVDEAAAMASVQQLDFLELVADDGTIISSAQWPARFGYKETWVTQPVDWASQGPFLKREELPDGMALNLAVVRVVAVAGKKLYIIGGRRMDREFLSSLELPEGMRALLYRNTEPGVSAAGFVPPLQDSAQLDKLTPIIQDVQQHPREVRQRIEWSSDPADAETLSAIPLLGRQNDLLGVLLVGRPRRELVELNRHIRFVAMLVAAGGILLGFIVSWWTAVRVTRPVEQLAAAASQVASGNWSAQVEVASADEIGQLAGAFNKMTRELSEQRERLLQAERVAAWRELARRLAHELKNPLFPLQITVENMLRARESDPAQFDEVFRESAAAMLAELANLKAIVGRFSDFARMPRPEPQAVDLNDVVRQAVRLYQPQFSANGKPPIEIDLQLDDGLGTVQADPDLMHRAVQNLIVNAQDAMPAGGTLRIRTSQHEDGVRVEISDTGAGLTPEECERLFTPYYTTKTHGTGLGLAIVQSVVSDHGGTISVSSQPQKGTTFVIDLPKGSSP